MVEDGCTQQACAFLDDDHVCSIPQGGMEEQFCEASPAQRLGVATHSGMAWGQRLFLHCGSAFTKNEPPVGVALVSYFWTSRSLWASISSRAAISALMRRSS